MGKYRKLSIEIEAIELTGTEENLKELRGFMKKDYLSIVGGGMTIETLEGKHWARIGDYIIRGIQGEFYPCKPDIFLETYEEIR